MTNSAIDPWIAKFPKKLWIGTYEVPISFVAREHPKLTDEEGEADGCTEYGPAEIFLCNGLTLTILLETIYHEVTHFVNFVGAVEDGSPEEHIADQHGKVWTLVWINNPKFQRWWTAACVEVRKEREGKAAKKKKAPK